MKFRLTTSVLAAATTLAPLCSQALEAEANPREGFGLGLALMSEQKPYRNVDNKLEVWPMLTYENRWLRVAGPGVDFKLGKSGSLSYALTASFSREGYKASDSSYLDGMDERKDGVWLGGRVTWIHEIANLSAAWRGDASSHSKGQKLTLGAEHRFSVDKLGITPRVAAIWQDRKYVDYYYGVKASEVRADRAAYAGSSTVNGEVAVRVDYRLSSAQSVFVDAGVTLLGAGITDSPLVSRSTVGALRLGYLYRF
ncbi:MipA/OmpV family protein [Uliginosibacterium sediminicola]|uniref:MipA/OmpV family protein n=1 Tax=Uliginosibacterium sediminicola TaxID=2024550 RepID=A0ABU9YZ76_9RHOO